MKVALDAQLTVGTATGIGEYARGLAVALRAAGTDVAELCEPRLDPWRFDRRVYWDQVLLPQRARDSGADVLHCVSGTMPLRSSLPTVVTVHDVAWLRVQQHARPYARWYFGRFALDRYRHARRIFVDSNFSRNELLDIAPDIPPERVSVVYPGVADDFCQLERRSASPPVILSEAPAGAESKDRGTTDPFILVVGTVERRKNLELVIRTLPELPSARVVSVGPFTPYADECRTLAVELGVADRVELRGYVDRSALLQLYATCAVAAVPSTYEGFGYAAAQALCAGVPLVSSNATSLPEIVEGRATLVPPGELDAWIEALRSGLQGALDATAIRAREDAIARFSWKSAAETIQRVYCPAVRIAE